MENKLQYRFLRKLSLFSQLKEVEIKELYLLAEYKSLKKDEIIYSSMQEIDKLYILAQGRIKIAYRVKKNEEVVSEILKEGDIFGELTLKQSENSSCEFAQVLTGEAWICSFPLNTFKQLLSKSPELSANFSLMVAEKIKIISRKYCDLVFKDVRSRVLNFFRLHAQYEGKWSGNQAVIKMYCTHQDIADFTASSRQTVSTIINSLIKEKKIIYQGRTKLIIPNIQSLKM